MLRGGVQAMSTDTILLCTDLDGTVLGDAEGEDLFRAWAASARATVRIAYVTGRNWPSVRGLIDEGRVPVPDFAVCDLGTHIVDLGDPDNRLGRRYEGLADPAWPADLIRQIGAHEQTWLQGPEGQGRFKSSFFWNGQEQSLIWFRERLGRVPDWRLIVTSGTYLDVVPTCFGKDNSARFLAESLGLDLSHVLVAGDSENDADMLGIGARAILPANARAAALEAAARGDHFLSRLPQGRGLLDGLRHFGVP
jgi:hydroxymethylpyrimidine pyrophosphatase-like HAD family hydrolase